MKKIFKTMAMAVIAVAMASCGGDGTSSSSSSGLFGSVISIIDKTAQQEDELEAKMNSNNFGEIRKKIEDLKKESKEKMEKASEALTGKEVKLVLDAEQLKEESPVTLVFRSMNAKAPNFGMEGKVVAAKDLTLNIPAKELKPSPYLSGKFIVKVKMPVGIEMLDKEGNVVFQRNEVGTLPAVNDGSTAVVKAGTPLDFNQHTFTISDKMKDVESIRLYIDLSKTPYYNTVAEE